MNQNLFIALFKYKIGFLTRHAKTPLPPKLPKPLNGRRPVVRHTYMANRFSWQDALILGVVQFVVFYWILPAWINHQLDSLQSNMFRPVVEAIFAKRVHWLQWLATALALICGFFSVQNYFAAGKLDRYGERQIGFISRFLARWFD